MLQCMEGVYRDNTVDRENHTVWVTRGDPPPCCLLI